MEYMDLYVMCFFIVVMWYALFSIIFSLFPPLRSRFNLSFEEQPGESDGSDVDSDETGRPRFSSIKKVTGFLDKELAASGFSRKDQDDIEKV